MALSDDDLKALRQSLVERLETLRAASTDTAANRKPVELDQTTVGRLSRMDAMQQQAMALASENARNVDVQRVQSAIARIDQGDYGYCTVCDEEIAPKRLAVDPTIPTCIKCASEAE